MGFWGRPSPQNSVQAQTQPRFALSPQPSRRVQPAQQQHSHVRVDSAQGSRDSLSRDTTRSSSAASHHSTRSSTGAEGLARTLLGHGRRIKRHASKLSLASNASATAAADDDAVSGGVSAYVLSTPVQTVVADDASTRHSPISQPCNFQHLTHTKAKQFTNIARTSQNDLIAEFSAVRAAQITRRDLRGIKAQDLHSRSSSVDTASTVLSSAVPSLASGSSRDSLNSSGFSTPASRRSVRSVRSKDSFSQPFCYGRPPMAPPRTSSRKAFTRCFHASPVQMGCDSGFVIVPDGELNESFVAYPWAFSPTPPRCSMDSADAVESYYHAISDDRLDEWGRAGSPTILHGGGGLESVDEEDGPSEDNDIAIAITTDDAERDHAFNVRESIVSLASEQSSNTITPASYAKATRDTLLQSDGKAQSETETAVLNVDARASLLRSSLSGGLFSSWRDDEDDECLPTQPAQSRKQNQDESNTPVSSIATIVTVVEPPASPVQNPLPEKVTSPILPIRRPASPGTSCVLEVASPMIVSQQLRSSVVSNLVQSTAVVASVETQHNSHSTIPQVSQRIVESPDSSPNQNEPVASRDDSAENVAENSTSPDVTVVKSNLIVLQASLAKLEMQVTSRLRAQDVSSTRERASAIPKRCKSALVRVPSGNRRRKTVAFADEIPQRRKE